MKKACLVLTVICLGALSGCTSSGTSLTSQPLLTEGPSLSTPGRTSERPRVDGEALRGGRTGSSYDVTKTIEGLADKMPTALAGEVASWTDGAVMLDHDERGYTAVLKIKVSTTWKGAARVKDGYIYVTRPRGGEIVDRFGTLFRNPGARSAVTTLEELRAAVPAGTRVLFVGDAGEGVFQYESPPLVRTLAPHAGYPAGATLLRPHVFGLLLEQNDGSVISGSQEEVPWDSTGQQARSARLEPFAYLTARLRQHFR